MKINYITGDFAVAPQVNIADIKQIKQCGFNSIICNRPDHEESGQPEYQDIKKEALKQGIKFEFLPLINTQVNDDEIYLFEQLIAKLPEPVLAYCRTGTRSATLWAYSQANHISLAEIANKTKLAGYDMSEVIQVINNRKRLTSSKHHS